MKILPKDHLIWLLEKAVDKHAIFKEDILELFDKYGDDYVISRDDHTRFECVNRNPERIKKLVFEPDNNLTVNEVEADECIKKAYDAGFKDGAHDGFYSDMIDDDREDSYYGRLLPTVYPKSEIKVEDMGRYDPYTDKFIKEEKDVQIL